MVDDADITISDLPVAVAASRLDILGGVQGLTARGFPLGLLSDFIKAELAGTAPATLDTIEEIAAALQGNPDFYAALTAAIALKANAADTTIHALTAKTTLVDADEFRLADSAASFGNKRATLAGLRAAIGGFVVQTASSFSGAVATGTALIPDDDTIPQNTEGTEFLTVSITPKSASNILEIDVQLTLSLSTGAYRSAALFRNGVANALQAVQPPPQTSGVIDVANMKHRMVAGTTSAITFSVRAGPSGAATMTINGSGGTRKFGGAMNSYIQVKEYTP